MLVLTTADEQRNEAGLQTLLEEDPLFVLRPFDVVLKGVGLSFFGTRDLAEAINQSTNYSKASQSCEA